MTMIQNSRVLIGKEDKILLIHRVNKGREYYVIPGGHVENGETPILAAIREIKEETNLDIRISELLWIMTDDHLEDKVIYVYKADSFSGELMLIGPEKETENENNKFLLEWIDVKNIKNMNIVPEKLKEKLASYYLDRKIQPNKEIDE